MPIRVLRAILPPGQARSISHVHWSRVEFTRSEGDTTTYRASGPSYRHTYHQARTHGCGRCFPRGDSMRLIRREKCTEHEDEANHDRERIVTVCVDVVDRIQICVCIEVQTAAKPRRVLAGPPARGRVVVPRPEAHEPRVAIPEPTRKAEGLEARIGIVLDDSPLVEIDPLHDVARRGVDDEARAFQVAAAAKPARRRSDFERAKTSVTILVIEDDPTIRELLELLLNDAGYRSTSVADGVAALACAERPDLVIADFNLPNGPNGVELIAELRQRFERNIPAIVLTGDISTETLHAIASRGCTHLDKPVEAAELLRVIAHALSATTQMAAPDKQAGASNNQPSVTVFVVDDDAGVRETVRDMLEAHGLSVESYASCEAFLHALRPGSRGCLVIDALLPEMDGFELLSRLEAEKIALPSIMITGHGDISMAVKAMQAGASDFLEKPFSREDLVAAVTHALTQNRESDPSSERRTAAVEKSCWSDVASTANPGSRARRASQQEHCR